MPDPIAAYPAPDSASFLAGYRPAAGTYDELYAPDGSVRPHWSSLIASLTALGADEFGLRWNEARRLMREHGVTYNVYDEAQTAERLWALDPIPVVLPAAEWQRIERALAQRAELLKLILADLYGPQTLIRRGLIPAEAIHAHPGFARPCVGVPPPRGRSLPLYAADVGRRADGSFCVLADYTQSPAGTGYALENRAALSRMLPGIFRDARVHRLPLFFHRLRTALGALAARAADDGPHVVLLTPGPGSETYFEHAFLASELGCTLAQGDDLTVRDQRLWLRTLEGLRPVDVVVRRVDGAFCDPLEMRADSLLGVPGLLQAARRGHIAIANPLGSSAVENPALLALLPRLARELLGAELVLPSVPTWWCGERTACAHVLERLDELVITPLAARRADAALFVGGLDSEARAALVAQIRAHPYRYVASEPIAWSTAPALVDGRLEPRAMVLRAFLAADAGGYAAMPGALVRVASAHDSGVLSSQRGGVSKDLWVLTPELERDTGAWHPADRPLPLARGGQEVPGRVADNLFWAGRYAERAEAGARIVREVLRRLLDLDSGADDRQLPALLRAVTAITASYPGFIGADADERRAAPHAELRAVLFDARRTGSVRFNIVALVRAARAVRDRFSTDTWRVISTLDRDFAEPHVVEQAIDRLDRILLLLAAFGGLSADSMSRGQRWRFLEIGRRLERAMSGVTLLRACCSPEDDPAALPWESLLAVADASITYRRRYRASADPGAVLDLLLDDDTNPRSVRYQLLQLVALLDGLAGPGPANEPPAEEAMARTLLAELHHGAASDALQPRRIDRAFDETLARVQALLAALSDQLARSYFTRGPQAQQLVQVL